MTLPNLLKLAALLPLGMVVPTAYAVTCDLGAGLNSSCTINGAIYENPANSVTVGSGVIDPFLTIQRTGSESGFSTDAASNNLPLDVKRAEGNNQFTRTFTAGQLGTVSLGGTSYYQFFLDINEPAAANMSGLSLDLLKIYNAGEVGAVNLGAGTTLADLNTLFGAPLYDLGDNRILLDYNLIGSGSGKGFDMDVLIPTSLFNISPDSRLVFASQFGVSGGSYQSQAGFEEWTYLRGNAVPEPGSLALFSLGLGLIAFRRRSRS